MCFFPPVSAKKHQSNSVRVRHSKVETLTMSPMPPFINHKWAPFPVSPFGEDNHREKLMGEIDFAQQLGAKLYPKKEDPKPAEPSVIEKKMLADIGKIGDEVGHVVGMMKKKEKDDDLARAKAMGVKEGEEKARQAMGVEMGVGVRGCHTPFNGYPHAIANQNMLPGHVLPGKLPAALILQQQQYATRRRSSNSERAVEILRHIVRREERMDDRLSALEHRTSWIEQEAKAALGRVRHIEGRAYDWDGGLCRFQRVERKGFSHGF